MRNALQEKVGEQVSSDRIVRNVRNRQLCVFAADYNPRGGVSFCYAEPRQGSTDSLRRPRTKAMLSDLESGSIKAPFMNLCGPLNVGLFGLGLDAYWPQFAGLRDRLESYVHEVARKIGSSQVQVTNLGLIDTPQKALAAG